MYRLMRRVVSQPALIATVVGVPMTLIAGLLLKSVAPASSSAPPSAGQPATLAPLTTVAAPPSPSGATAAACAAVIDALPLRLGGLSARAVQGAAGTWDVVAWGEPAIVLRCGIGRPTRLVPGSDDFVIDVGDGRGHRAEWFHAQRNSDDVFTTIDRSVYIDVSVPTDQAYQPLPVLTGAIATVLPAVCQAFPDPAPTQITPELLNGLCVNRK